MEKIDIMNHDGVIVAENFPCEGYSFTDVEDYVNEHGLKHFMTALHNGQIRLMRELDFYADLPTIFPVHELQPIYAKILKEKRSKASKKGWKTRRIKKIGFNNLRSHEKWDAWREQKGTWHCSVCGTELKDGPNRASPFRGSSVHCSNCDAELTCRTGGGQVDPFKWVLKKI